MSKLKLLWKAVCGFINPFGSVVESLAEYALDYLNNALAEMNPDKREQIQAVLNITQKVLSILTSLKWLCPTKWQSAYCDTIIAVSDVATSLEDMKVTADELANIRARFADAIAAWKCEDDSSCVDESCIE